jgi:hypothetical protein
MLGGSSGEPVSQLDSGLEGLLKHKDAPVDSPSRAASR